MSLKTEPRPHLALLSGLKVGMWASREHERLWLMTLPPQQLFVFIVETGSATGASPPRRRRRFRPDTGAILRQFGAHSPFSSSFQKSGGCVFTFEASWDSISGLDYSNPLIRPGRLVLEAAAVRKREFASLDAALRYYGGPMHGGQATPASLSALFDGAYATPSKSHIPESMSMAMGNISTDEVGGGGRTRDVDATPAATRHPHPPSSRKSQESTPTIVPSPSRAKDVDGTPAATPPHPPPSRKSQESTPTIVPSPSRAKTAFQRVRSNLITRFAGAGAGGVSARAAVGAHASREEGGAVTVPAKGTQPEALQVVGDEAAPSGKLPETRVPGSAPATLFSRRDEVSFSELALRQDHQLEQKRETNLHRDHHPPPQATHSTREGDDTTDDDVASPLSCSPTPSRTSPAPLSPRAGPLPSLPSLKVPHSHHFDADGTAGFSDCFRLFEDSAKSSARTPHHQTESELTCRDMPTTVPFTTCARSPLGPNNVDAIEHNDNGADAAGARNDDSWPPAHTRTANVYEFRLISAYWTDPHLPSVLKPVLEFNERLLHQYESGLPSWAVFFPQYGLPYRPYFRSITWVLFYVWSVVSLALGFYDLYKCLPGLQALLSKAADDLWLPHTALMQWIEQHAKVRLSILLTYLFGKSELAYFVARAFGNAFRASQTALQPLVVATSPLIFLLRTATRSLIDGTAAVVLPPLRAAYTICSAPLFWLCSFFNQARTAFTVVLTGLNTALQSLTVVHSTAFAADVSATTAGMAGAARNASPWVSFWGPVEAWDALHASLMQVSRALQSVWRFINTMSNGAIRHRMTLSRRTRRCWRTCRVRVGRSVCAPVEWMLHGGVASMRWCGGERMRLVGMFGEARQAGAVSPVGLGDDEQRKEDALEQRMNISGETEGDAKSAILNEPQHLKLD